MPELATPVPFKLDHAEFQYYIGSFPEQIKHEHGPNVISQKQVILDHLRLELRQLAVNPQQVQDYMCYRNCFKWDTREHVDFCLQRKCGNPGFEAAAEHLGLLKK